MVGETEARTEGGRAMLRVASSIAPYRSARSAATVSSTRVLSAPPSFGDLRSWEEGV
jgi:hypothetical protein